MESREGATRTSKRLKARADAAVRVDASEERTPPPVSASETPTSANARVAAAGVLRPAVRHEKLLVLDLNGLFIDRRARRYVPTATEKASEEEEDAREAAAAAGGDELDAAPDGAEEEKREADPNEVVENARVGNYYVYDRPHMREFIEWVHERFEVGVWSSANSRNTKNLVNYVWGAHASKVAFVWGQERCSDIGKDPSGEGNRPLFLKELKHVWSMKKNTGLSRFNETNTLLIDDSPYKAIRNPENTAIHPRGYTVKERDTDDMLSERGALRQYLDRLAASASIPEFVASNPWNDGEIDEEHLAQVDIAQKASESAAKKAKEMLMALRDPSEIDLDDIGLL